MNCFDYSSIGYGFIIVPAAKYNFFLHIEATYVGGFCEMELLFYYRINEERLLEIAIEVKHDKQLLSQMHIVGIFELKEPFDRYILKGYIRKYIVEGRNYMGLGYEFYHSTIMTETQFRYLLEDISADLSINRYQINNRWKDSTLVELCNRYKFEVIPTPEYDHIAECRCPSGYSHRLTMNLETDSWYCGWCSKNGYLKELEMFFKKYN